MKPKLTAAAILPLVASVLCQASFAAASGDPIPEVRTVPHELDVLLKYGHIQGAACSEKGVYLSHQGGIEMIDWNGKLLKRVDATPHLGDIAYYRGRIYGAFVLRGREFKDRPGMVRVWDEELNVVREARFKEPLDGITVLDGIVYAGIDRWGYQPHRGCAVKKLDLELNELGNSDVDLGFMIHYGVQTMSNDGKDVLFGCYGVDPKKFPENGERKNFARLSKDLKVLDTQLFGCSEGFDRVPKKIADRAEDVFFTVNALGGNMQGWRKDPTNNPPRIALGFVEMKDGKISVITGKRKGN